MEKTKEGCWFPRKHMKAYSERACGLIRMTSRYIDRHGGVKGEGFDQSNQVMVLARGRLKFQLVSAGKGALMSFLNTDWRKQEAASRETSLLSRLCFIPSFRLPKENGINHTETIMGKRDYGVLNEAIKTHPLRLSENWTHHVHLSAAFIGAVDAGSQSDKHLWTARVTEMKVNQLQTMCFLILPPWKGDCYWSPNTRLLHREYIFSWITNTSLFALHVIHVLLPTL